MGCGPHPRVLQRVLPGPQVNVRVVADSIAPNGKRLTTVVMKLWRPLLAEFNTHRSMSRSSASSRAIPVTKMLDRIKRSPFVPRRWGSNKAGMQAGVELEQTKRDAALELWLDARDAALAAAQALSDLGVHKSIPNRLLEPWMETEVVVTATEWENMLALRTELDEEDQPLAEYHFYEVAEELLAALNESEPRSLRHYQWHLPFVDVAEQPAEDRPKEWKDLRVIRHLIMRSVARCGRVSYLKHDGTEATPAEDAERHDGFLKYGHWGPLEHQAQPSVAATSRSGNLVGWVQYRKRFPNEERSFSRLSKKEWKG